MVGLRAKRPHFTEKWLRFTLHFVAHFYSARNSLSWRRFYPFGLFVQNLAVLSAFLSVMVLPPLGGQSLRLFDLLMGHPRFDLPNGLICFHAIGLPQVEPFRSLNIILGNPFAVGIHDPKVELRFSISLFGGLAIPRHRLRRVLGNPFAMPIHEPKVELRTSISLLSRHARPRLT